MDPTTITWRRVIDVNDRMLREIEVGLGPEEKGFEHRSGYDITVASEIMAILCLSKSYAELKKKIRNILVGFTADDRPVLAGVSLALVPLAAYGLDAWLERP